MKLILKLLLLIFVPIFLKAQTDWRSDLTYFNTELPNSHKNLFSKISKKEFDAKVDALIKESAMLSPIAIGIRLQQLIADIGDPHTTISLGKFIDKEKILPIQAYWFDDGFYITKTSESHKNIVGSKIKKINGHDIKTIADSLATLLVQDNPSINKAYLLRSLPIVEVLVYFGFAGPDKEIICELENQNGIFKESFEIGKKEKLTVHLPVEKLGIGYQDQQTYFWEQYIPEDSIYFVQYNKCWSKNMEKKYGDKNKAGKLPDFKSFSKKVFSTIETKPVKKFIFDMRHNGGGSSLQGTLFVMKLKKRKKINQKGKLFVIIGRNTFSSAIINTVNFKNQTKAILIGEETAGSPDHYGEVRSFKLPSSGVRVRYSTKYFNFTKQNMKSIKPDIAVPVYFTDFIVGKDAAFETAKNYKLK